MTKMCLLKRSGLRDFWRHLPLAMLSKAPTGSYPRQEMKLKSVKIFQFLREPFRCCVLVFSASLRGGTKVLQPALQEAGDDKLRSIETGRWKLWDLVAVCSKGGNWLWFPIRRTSLALHVSARTFDSIGWFPLNLMEGGSLCGYVPIWKEVALARGWSFC